MNNTNFNTKRRRLSKPLRTILDSSFDELKQQYDVDLKDHKLTRNDEPTPIDLVQEVLNYVPLELWGRQHLQILDICAGLGNWGLVLWDILGKRFHESVVINELSGERLLICQQILNTSNVYNQDALTMEGEYDLVVANPPYALVNSNGQRASKNHNLVNLFIEKSLKLCKKGGYIAFVVPNSWCSPSKRNTLCEVLTSLQFHVLNLNECKKWFPKVGSSFTYFVVENTPHYQPFCCISKFNGELTRNVVQSMTRKWLPLHWNNEVKFILSQTVDNVDAECFAVQTSSDLHNTTKKHLLVDERDDEHPYEVVHTFNKTRWSSKPHKYQAGWKVLINLTSNYDLRIVCDVGMTQSVAFILCDTKEEASTIRETLSKPIYKYLNNLHRFGNFNNILLLKRLPKQIRENFGGS